jgi:hypothetical protein
MSPAKPIVKRILGPASTRRDRNVQADRDGFVAFGNAGWASPLVEGPRRRRPAQWPTCLSAEWEFVVADARIRGVGKGELDRTISQFGLMFFDWQRHGLLFAANDVP